MSIAIKVENLTKNYGKKTAIQGISFEVEQGEIFALLGTNGAGKTTTLECIEKIRKYDSGSITIKGKTGIQLQSSSLPENIRVIEVIKLLSKWNKASIEESTIKAFGLENLKNKEYSHMSTGQKRRLHLVLALIGNPDIIFLDEPTAGLDVEGRVSLHKEIRKLKAKGKTIIMASHDMAEVENLCDRIAILKDGEIAFLGTSSQLTSHLGNSSVIQVRTSQGEEIFITENIGDTLLNLLETYKRKQINVLDIQIQKPTLEEKFMEIARRNQ